MMRAIALLGLLIRASLSANAATAVNINKADAATIAQALDGIGASKAAAIVAYRDAHGPFKNVDELGQVKGVGASTLARNRDAIELGDDTGVPAKDSKAVTKKTTGN